MREMGSESILISEMAVQRQSGLICCEARSEDCLCRAEPG